MLPYVFDAAVDLCVTRNDANNRPMRTAARANEKLLLATGLHVNNAMHSDRPPAL